jgi:hypothetical protein
MPSTTSSVVSMRLGFFDRDRAVLAHLVHRVGNDVADGLVAVRGNCGDLLISLRSLTFLLILASCSTTVSVALPIPRCSAIGLAPAVTLRRPSR